MGLDVLSPAESPKSMLTPFRSANYSREPAAVLSAQGRTVRARGPDGPRPGARRWCFLVRRGRSAAQGRTIRDLVQEPEFPA
jgi:hypothetical protein